MFTHQPKPGASWSFEAGTATASVASTATAEGLVQGTAPELKQATWLFAVDDDHGGIVISGEYSDGGTDRNYLRLVRMADPTQASTYPIALNDPSAVKFDALTAGFLLHFDDDISDHWHIFAHGHHYITYSHADTVDFGGEGKPQALAILCLDTLFRIVGNVLVFAVSGTKYAGTGELYSESSAVAFRCSEVAFRTNDHFLVAQSGGVAIGIRMKTGGADGLPGLGGHFVMRLNWDLTKRSCFAFHPENGTDVPDHANAASALSRAIVRGSGPFEIYSEISDHYDVIAPDTIEVDEETGLALRGGLLFLRTNEKFKTCYRNPNLRIRVPRYQLAMGTQVEFANGWRVITFRARSVDSDGTGDFGDIWRCVFDETDQLQTDPPKVLTTTGDCNRPHTMRWGDYLITTWDQVTYGAQMRVDRITFA